jgi:outer membrane immunogenic protein
MKNKSSVIAGIVGLFALAQVGAAEAQPYNWTGFYAGANAGYASGSSDTVSLLNQSPPSPGALEVNSHWSPTLHPNGFSGGMQAGYNRQWGSWVFGGELDMNSFATSDQKTDTNVYPGFAPTTYTIHTKVDTDWLFTLRPRIGWAANNWLFYVTGGLAVTDMHANWRINDMSGNFESASASATRAGGIVGGGIEIGLTPQWSLKAEYLYMSFGSISANSVFTVVGPGGFGIPSSHTADLNSSLGRVGVNYRF